MAEELQIKRDLYASYELGRVRLKWPLAMDFCYYFIVSQKWLATGEGEMDSYRYLTREAWNKLQTISRDVAFADAYKLLLAEDYEYSMKLYKSPETILDYDFMPLPTSIKRQMRILNRHLTLLTADMPEPELFLALVGKLTEPLRAMMKKKKFNPNKVSLIYDESKGPFQDHIMKRIIESRKSRQDQS